MRTDLLLSRAFSVPGQILWDENKQLIVLLSESNQMLAAMSYIHADTEHLRVTLVASYKSHLGLGYRVYLGALAALYPFTLSADDCSVSGNSIRIWEQLYQCSGLTKESLYGSPAYNPAIDSELFEELSKSNPQIMPEQWCQWEDGKEMQSDPEAFMIRAAKEDWFNPHIYNMGFSLTDKLADHLVPLVAPASFNKLQAECINQFLSDTHGRYSDDELNQGLSTILPGDIELKFPEISHAKARSASRR
jgi:hypothetical protein